MKQTVQSLINQFKLEISLPTEILDIEVDGEYNDVSKEPVLLNYVNTNLMIELAKFECYVLNGTDCKVIIAPTNKYSMLSVYHKLKDNMVGCSYNFLGEISSTT